MSKTLIITLNGGPLNGQSVDVPETVHAQGVAPFRHEDKTVLYGLSKATGLWTYLDTDLIPDVQPETGRLVWYVPKPAQLLMYKLADAKPLPAMVIRVEENGVAVLRVFTCDRDFTAACGYHRKKVAGCWCWPDMDPKKRTFADLLKFL